jgi:methyl-accepting chemotaxis protein
LKKNEKTKHLSLTIALLFAGSMAVLLGAQALMTILRVNSGVSGLTEQMSLEIGRARSTQIEEWLGSIENEVRLDASAAALRSGDEQKIFSYLVGLNLTSSDTIEDLFFVNPAGVSFNMERQALDVTDREYYKSVVKDGAERYIGNPVISKQSGKPVVVIGRAVKDAAGRTLGMMGGTIRLSVISDIVSTIKLGEGYGYVVDGNGLVIAHPNKDYTMKLNLFEGSKSGFSGLEAIAAKMAKGESGSGDMTNPAGTKQFVIFCPIPGTPNWSFGLSIPREQMDATANQLVRVLIVLTLVILLVVIALSFLIARSIVHPILIIASGIRDIASGDLAMSSVSPSDREKIEIRRDEVGLMGKGLAEMAEGLTRIVRDIRSAAGQVASGSEQISSTAQQLSQGSTEQAASTEEASSSVEEMTATIKQNSDNSLATESIAKKASSDAATGGEAVLESVEAMKEIAEKIGIIDEIARQTNLLALNAAIEAARAGEAGKGFAVVASEVRKLAERSQKASGEITVLTRRTMDTVTKAGDIIQKIVPDIAKTAGLVEEISSASREQSSGADQIAKAMMQLDTVVQQNASASEEMASMAEELSGQAEALGQVLAFFKTAEGQEQQPGPETAARPTARAERVRQESAPRQSRVEAKPLPTAPAVVRAIRPAPAASPDDTEFEEF